MIGFLTGRPELLSQNVLIHVNGVGYLVSVGTKMLQNISGKDQVGLFIYTHVTDSEISLFGFGSMEEKKLFMELLAISGIGPKTALAIIDTSVEKLVEAVQNADVRFFSKIPRIGKKSAQRIIIELKPKLGSLKELNLAPMSSFESDLVSALESLGFNHDESESVVKQLELDESLGIQAALQQAMKFLAK